MSRSSGETERASMTSSEVPSPAAVSAARRIVLTDEPYPTTVTSVPTRRTSASKSPRGAVSMSTSPFSQ